MAELNDVSSEAWDQPWGWETFFSELVRFLQTSERQYAGANQQYTDYVVDRLALSQGFWSGGDFGPGGPKSPGSGQIKRSGLGILVRALKSLSSFVYQRPCMFQHAACTPGLPDEVK